MIVRNLFSKRQRALRGEVPDVFTYDSLPAPLRVQIVQMLRSMLGTSDDILTNGNMKFVYMSIVEQLCREYGVFELPPADKYRRREYPDELADFILKEADVERVLDAVELSFQAIDGVGRNYQFRYWNNASSIADQTIGELNARFKEHGIGFQFESGEIVRVDSAFLHSEAVKPALRLLNGEAFAGAQQEFLSAHEHYRHGRPKEALNDCLKAFESVMKAICKKRDWEVSGNATAKDLIETCLANGLIPSFWQTNFASLRSLLESGIPTGRNKLGGHGQGTMKITVPDHLVAYMLHMTASGIVFLVDAEADL